jgi:hypothetical protein
VQLYPASAGSVTASASKADIMTMRLVGSVASEQEAK